MSDRCEPPEGLRDRPGYHWLRRADTEGRTPPVIWTWRTPEMVWRSQGIERRPEEMHHEYVAPTPPPATVRALVEALEAAVESGIVPKSSTAEGGAMRFSRQVQVADQIRAVLARAKAEGL